MAATYTLIASNTLTSTSASVTFSSIPNTYTDLVLRWSARTDQASAYTSIFLKVNSATGLSSTYVEANGSTASSARLGSGDGVGAYLEPAPANTATSNTFSNGEIYVPSYTASQNKPIGAVGTAENNSATVNGMGAVAALYSNTSAITSLTLYMLTAGNFVAGSSFFLYGIKNS